jgi:putative redox protein
MAEAADREGPTVIARAEGDAPFLTRVEVPGGSILLDEPAEVGGGGAGPTPYQLLSAALAACTSMTLRLYAARQGWSLPPFAVEVEHGIVPGAAARDRFTRRIRFSAPVRAEERARYLETAQKCPVHRTLAGGGAAIVTTAEAPAMPGPPPLMPADPPEAHLDAMARASLEKSPKPL